MSWNELLAAALTLVVGFALKAFFAWIGYPVDPGVFNAIVAALVSALLALFGVQAFKAMGVKGLR